MSLKVGRVMGIPIRIHFSFWPVFALIAWSLATGYLPDQYPGLRSTVYWEIGVASAAILFVSVLAHELSHSYVAARNGLRMAGITLFFFGGVSELAEDPHDPGVEARMAAAGPLMSVALAGTMFITGHIAEAVSTPLPVVAALSYGALINGLLAAFNLVPAFPMDGGRLLRGLIWKKCGNLMDATKIATRVSETLALLAMVGGVALVITGDFLDGIWIMMLAWFVRSGAEASLKQARVEDALAGVSVGDLVDADAHAVSPGMTIRQFVSECAWSNPRGGYPVVDGEKTVGLMTIAGARAIPPNRVDSETVGQVMIPRGRLVEVKPKGGALEALRTLIRKGVKNALVVGDDGKVLGAVSLTDMIRAAKSRLEPAQGNRRGPHYPRFSPNDSAKSCVQCGARLPVDAKFCSECAARQPAAP